MRTTLSLALLACALGASACDELATEPGGPLDGTWRYTVTGFAVWGSQSASVCDLETTMTLTQEGNVVSGETAEAGMTCVNTETGQVSEHPPLARAVHGEVQDGRIHFSLSGGFHSFGEVPPGRPARITGDLESYGGLSGGPIVAERSGAFVLQRLP